MSLPEIDLNRVTPDAPCIVGRGVGSDFVIDHESVSRRHARLERDQSGRIRLVDEGSRFGTFVNKIRIQSRVLGEEDIVRFGAGAPYRFGNDILIPRPELVGLSIRFEGLSLDRGGRPVLRRVAAEIVSDEFVAIAGPSGCGKSTLLECLADFHEIGKGAIVFDQGKSWRDNFEYVRQKTRVVPQKNLLFEDLTLRENLRFSLRLKEPELPLDEIEEFATAAMEAVDLLAFEDSIVGVLSGGQKKRASVAVELTSRPRLLLLDEPTSGLDPGMEADLFDKLKALAQRGMTVVCVAHTTNLRFFDKVILLRALGEAGPELDSVAYCGAPEGLPGPGQIEQDATLRLGPAAGDEEGRPEGEAPEVRIERPKCENAFFSSQCRTVLERCFVSCLRDRKALWLNLLLPVLTGAMIAASQRGFAQPAHIGFFLVISAFWFGMTSGVREIIKERGLYVRDKLGGLIPSAYFLGKTGYVAALAVIQALLLYLSALAVLGALQAMGPASGVNALLIDKLGPGPVILSTLPLVVAGLGGVLAGLTVSVLSTSERMAATALPMILLPQILFSRVALGQASEILLKPPFGFLAGAPEGGWIDWLLYWVSLGFVTRPCATLFHLCFDRSGQNPATAQVIEWIYMVVLLGAYFFVTRFAFDILEKRWKDWR